MFPTAFCGNQFMSDAQQDTILERRVVLPEPDVSNITVLTESLPNGPVLPWHHFDSPWLERDDAESPNGDLEAGPDGDPGDGPEIHTEPEPAEQLTLALVLIEAIDDAPKESLGPSSLPDKPSPR
jgi:hypothetical protein